MRLIECNLNLRCSYSDKHMWTLSGSLWGKGHKIFIYFEQQIVLILTALLILFCHNDKILAKMNKLNKPNSMCFLWIFITDTDLCTFSQIHLLQESVSESALHTINGL